eukprot:6381431-Alexandrium_andersonii.AAC.1
MCIRDRLSIVGTDNRILASATKFCLHDFLEKWVSRAQQGFLNGRSMHHNILQAECAMQRYSLQHPRAVAIFFDFKAAFPSVSH